MNCPEVCIVFKLFFRKLKIELSYDPVIMLLGISLNIESKVSKRYLQICVYSIIHNSQEIETTHVSIHGMWYIHKRNIVSLKKEGNTVTSFIVDEPVEHHIK